MLCGTMPLRPRPALGAPLDLALRRSVLRRYEQAVGPFARSPVDAIWREYLDNLGCGDALELANRLERLYDPPTADLFRDTLARRLSTSAAVKRLVGEELPQLLAFMAVRVPEVGLCTLAEATGGNRKGASAGQLFGALRERGVLAADCEWLVLGANRLRNAVEHQRGVAREVDRRTAQAALGGAANAIAYVASLMPDPATRSAEQEAAGADDVAVPR